MNSLVKSHRKYVNAQDFWEIPTLIPGAIEGIISGGLKMYLVESKGGAIACMLLSLFCLGTWPAIFTLLERKGRLPQHTYLDYLITNLLVSLFFAFTFGEIGKSTPETPNFINQLSKLSENWPSVMFAMAGGIMLSIGNMCTQYALAFVGLSVTEVITSSTCVVIGTTINYFLDNRINKAEILFPGVGCFMIAVCLAAALHSSNASDNREKLNSMSNDRSLGKQSAGTITFEKAFSNKEIDDQESGMEIAQEVKFGTRDFLLELENTRAIKVFGKSTLTGLFIALFGGVCFSLFSPAFNLATNDQWNTLKKGVSKLDVYTAFFWFSLSSFVLGIIVNITFLYRPVLNLPRSSMKAYLKDSNGRGLAFLSGLLCGLGNGLEFMGGEAAGYAAADAVQAFPLVCTFWGIVLFGEYRRSSTKTYALLINMLIMFVVAVAVLMASAGHRK